MNRASYQADSERIKKLRCSQGLTQAGLVEEILRLNQEGVVNTPVSKRTIETVESSSTTQTFNYGTLNSIAVALRVPVKAIIRNQSDTGEVTTIPSTVEVSEEFKEVELRSRELAAELGNSIVERAHLLLAVIEFLIPSSCSDADERRLSRFAAGLKSELKKRSTGASRMIFRTEGFKNAIKRASKMAFDGRSESVGLLHLVTALEDDPGTTTSRVFQLLPLERTSLFDQLRKRIQPIRWETERPVRTPAKAKRER